MKLGNSKKLSKSLLIMYMISALLFLTSISLHIHANGGTNGGKISAENAAAVHISTIADEIASEDNSDEININPNGVLKLNQNCFDYIAVILLVTLIAVICHFECIARLREIHTRLPRLPFHGTPSLRAPPFFNS
jgi:hypothetical protein